MKLLAAIAMLVALIALGAGCGGGSSSTTTDSSVAASHAIERLLEQASEGTPLDSPGVGAGGQVLSPREAEEVLRRMRQVQHSKRSGAGTTPIEELLKRLGEAH